MSGGLEVLSIQVDDIKKMLTATTHIGSENSETTMTQYVYKKRSDGVNIINLKKTWEKILLAARAIAAIEHPSDVYVVSSRPFGQRAILKCGAYIGATTIAGRFTPGAFTNQIQAAFSEPRLLVVADPRADHQPVTEGSFANIPIIAFCNADSPTRFVDIAIPCNNKSQNSIGLMWWLLTREVLRLKSIISRTEPWDVMPDLFFYRDPEDAEKQEAALQEAAEQAKVAAAVPPIKPDDWDAGPVQDSADWGAEPMNQVAVSPAAVTAAPAAAPQPYVDDWNTTSDWSAADPTVQPTATEQWGGSTNWS